MPEVAEIRCFRSHVCYEVPFEKFSLTQIPAEFDSGATLLIFRSIKSVKEQLP
jgi:hypothetical protein